MAITAAARESFGIFKRSAGYEFAKLRNDFETGDQGKVSNVVGAVAERLGVSPADARAILDEDGWQSRFEQSPSAKQRDMMSASSTVGASPTQGAPVAAGQTVATLGGLKGWTPNGDE